MANLGSVLVRMGRPSEALPYYESAIQARPDNDKAFRGLGAALGALGRTDEAMTAVQRSLNLRADRPTSWALMGKLAKDSGDPQAAIDHLESALRIDPGLALARRDLFSIYREEGQTRASVEQLHQILQRSPGDFFALSRLAWIHATSSEPAYRDGPRALALALQACAGFDEPPAICLDTTAAVFAENRRFPEAIALTRRAIPMQDEGGSAPIP